MKKIYVRQKDKNVNRIDKKKKKKRKSKIIK